MKEKRNNENVAVICDDLTEFFAIKDAIDALKTDGLQVDIIVPYDSGYNGLAGHTLAKIRELGYSPLDDAPKDKIYKILFTPYPGLDVVKRLKYVYHIRYPYSVVSAKPNPSYLPDTRMDYDAIITFNTYESSFLDAYGAHVHPIAYWRYHNFKKAHHGKSKPTLLYLPTFGTDTGSINCFTDSAISEIKKHFFIIAKSHHATHFGIDGDKVAQNLKNIADEHYDSDTPIDQLLEKADLVLSDNSGSIFEALSAGVPVALFAKDLNSRHLGSIDTLQYLLSEQEIIPHTDQPEKILPMLLSIKKFVKKQDDVRKKLFVAPRKDDACRDFVDLVRSYLAMDETNDNHKALHDLLVREWRSDKQKILEQENQIEELRKIVDDLKSSTSWKITKPLRAIKRGKKHV